VTDLFKQEGEITIRGADGVHTVLPLAPALILFGRNDSGKTNTLRAITSLLRGEDPFPRDPVTEVRHENSSELVIPLDLERAAHRELLLGAAKGGTRRGAPKMMAPVFTVRESPVLSSKQLDLEEHEEARHDETIGKAETLVSSLRPALRRIIDAAVADDEQAELIVETLTRRARLTLTARAWVFDFGDTASLAQEALGHAYDAIRYGVGFQADHSSVVDLVIVDDFDVSTASFDIVDRIVRLIGWEWKEIWPGFTDSEVWQRDLENPNDSGYLELNVTYPWFDPETELPSQEVVQCCDELSKLATRIAPRFVTTHYRIELQALAPRWWQLNNGQWLRIALVPHDPRKWDSDEPTLEKAMRARHEVLHNLPSIERPPGYGLHAVGAGLQRWAMFAVYEALRQSSGQTERTTLFVFDEPERHLHPAAQREAASFIASIVRAGANVIIATHSPAFLNEPISHARYVRLSRIDGVTQAFPLDSGRLTAIERSFGDLGLTRADLIQLTRAVLLVEGEHDRFLVESFFGRQLADAHVRLLPIRGSENVLALLDAELLQKLAVPIFLMLDRTSSSFVDDLNRGRITFGRTKEERALAGLATALRSRAFPVTPLPLNVPDIVWTLPEKAVKLVAPRFPGWEQATADLRHHKGPINPKDLLRTRYGLGITMHVLQRIVAIAQEHELEPSPQLKRAIASLVQSVEGGSGPNN
jgi:hypothetical protein